MADDPAAQMLDAARARGSAAEVSGLGAALHAYRAAGPHGTGATAPLPVATSRGRARRVIGRLAAASLATKVALVTGAAVAAAAGSIAVTSVVEHRPQHPAPPATSLAPSPSRLPTSPSPSASGASHPSGTPSSPGSGTSGQPAPSGPGNTHRSGSEPGKHGAKAHHPKKPKKPKKPHKPHKTKKPEKPKGPKEAHQPKKPKPRSSHHGGD